jgi:hypothetical protein
MATQTRAKFAFTRPTTAADYRGGIKPLLLFSSVCGARDVTFVRVCLFFPVALSVSPCDPLGQSPLPPLFPHFVFVVPLRCEYAASSFSPLQPTFQ